MSRTTSVYDMSANLWYTLTSADMVRAARLVASRLSRFCPLAAVRFTNPFTGTGHITSLDGYDWQLPSAPVS